MTHGKRISCESRYTKRAQFSSNYLPSAASICHFARTLVTPLLRCGTTGLMEIIAQEETKRARSRHRRPLSIILKLRISSSYNTIDLFVVEYEYHLLRMYTAAILLMAPFFPQGNCNCSNFSFVFLFYMKT